MTLDTLRLAVVYYPLAMLLAALLVGFTLRDVFDLARILLRRLRKRHQHYLPEPRQ